MYLYTKEELENMANQINKKYYPERLEKVIPLDPYDLMEKLGLDVEWKHITPNNTILGMIFFEDGRWPIWDNSNYETGAIPCFETFKKGTIVIESTLTEVKNACREKFVCGHEIMHWIKDKEYFINRDTDFFHICKKEMFEEPYWNTNTFELEAVERQTNYLNAATLLPYEVLKREFFIKLRYKNIPIHPIEYKSFMKRVIRELAKEYGVNYNVVLYRLFDLNILKKNGGNVI